MKRIWCLLVFISVAVLACILFIQVNSYAGDTPPAIRVTDSLFSSAIISDTRSIIVGDKGKVFLCNDAGKTWKNITIPTKEPLSSVSFPDDHHGWITGQMGVILHSKDGGNTWKMQSSQTKKYLLGVDFLDPYKGFAVGEASLILKTIDGGKTWHQVNLNIPSDPEEESTIFESMTLFTVKMLDAENICIAGESGRIFLTKDAGLTWMAVKSPLYDEEMMEGKIIYAMAHDSGSLFAVGIDGAFIFSMDQGKTWQEGRTGLSEPELYGIDMDDNMGLAVGSGGHIIRTYDRGTTWEEINVPERITQAALIGIHLRKNDKGNVIGLVVGQNGRIGYYNNNKFNW